MSIGFATVLVFLVVASLFVGVALFIGRFLRPRVEEPDKGTIYDCGERPIGSARFTFNLRFYVIALVFIIFEVEVVLTYPVAVIFRQWFDAGWGAVVFFEIVVFLLILAAGLAYVWAKGDLEWIRKIKPGPEDKK